MSLIAAISEPSTIQENDLAVSLYPYQKEGVDLMVSKFPKCILGDEMGLGKTLQALAAVERNNAYPCLIVAPSSNKNTWAELEIPKCLPHRLVLRADKNIDNISSLFGLADIIVTNYEQLIGFRKDETGRRCSSTDHTKRKVILSNLAKKLQTIELKSIILDEAHKIKNMSSSTTRAVLSLLYTPEGQPRDIQYRYCLTGTPVLNHSREIAPMLRFFGYLDQFGGHWEFLKRYCGLRKGKFGIEAKANLNSVELHNKLKNLCYIRRLKKDVLPDLPPKTRSTLLVEIDNRDKYEQAEDQLIEWVQERVLEDAKFLESIKHLSREDQEIEISVRKHSKAEAAKRAEQVVRISALKQVTVEGKIKTGISWIKDFLETGEKLVVFAVHQKIIDILLATFPNAARIVSQDSSEERFKNVQRFQSDPNCRLIIAALGTSAGSSPGGVGHTLTAASNVLFLELGWNPALHDQAEDRCHRIGQIDNVTCHYLLGKDTIDQKIGSLIESKRKSLKAVSDGVTDDEEKGIMSELVDWLLTK